MAVAGGPAGRAVGTAAALLVVVATVTAQLAHDNNLETMHAGSGPVAAGLQVLAALVLVGAGLVVWFGQERRSVGPAILGAAVAWMAPVWIGWEGAPGLVASGAALIAPFLLPFLLDVALGFPDRGSREAPRRRLATAGYLLTALYVVLRAAVYDPFLDPRCWANCTDASFLVYGSPEAVSLLDGLWKVVVLGALLVLVAAAAGTRPRSTPSPTWQVVAAATAAGVTQAFRLLLSPGPEDPRNDLLQALFVAEAAALVVLAVALGWATWQREQVRAKAMGRLAQTASEAAGIHSLRAELALATGRPDLELAFWVPAAQRYVDANGRPMVDGPGDGDGDVTVLRGHTPVALIRSSRRTTSAAMVAEALGPAARLALDNERLRAEELFHLQRLAESRARIVAASDLARRELERDLHDGAQQRLLAVLYALQLAAGAARRLGDPLQGEALDGAIVECRAALAELRDLAHGIFPAILETAGLAPALATLGDQSRVGLVVDDRTDRELPTAVAHTAYLAVAWAVRAAAEAGAGPIRADLETVDGHLVTTIHGVPHYDHGRTSDRVSALGGRLSTDDGVLRVGIPCA